MSERAAPRRAGVRRFWLLAIAIVIALPSARGQTNAASTAQAEDPAAKPLEYDVVSIKLNKTAIGGWRMVFGDDRFNATNVSLKELLQLVYHIKEDLISGVSGPVSSEHFDIEAKILGPDPNKAVKLSDKQILAMVRPMLAERFQFKAHTEFKELPVYELIVLKDEPKFKQSTTDSQKGSLTSSWGDDKGSIVATAIKMTNLASVLSDQVHRTVIDKTGLTGTYDFTLKWSVDGVTDAPADAGPSIFTAVQEQLGLKLQPAKGPVATLVVDHAEMPSAN
jgi:uncharacterized protein (TIGR03435 family)